MLRGDFKKWIQNVLPAVYDESLSYQDLLYKIIHYLDNTMNEVDRLNENYIQLKQYCDNYFNNLDVQEEINNKLDEMANNGSLDEIISNYITPLIDIQNERINNINNKVNSVANGGSLAVSSINEMEDTTRTYVNTSDGKWYFYNGEEWVIGGIYQSSVDNKETIKNTTNINILEKRLENYDGLIKPSDLEIGRITYNQENGFAWIKDNDGKKCVSTKENKEYHLHQNEKVFLTDYTNYKFKIIYRDMNGSYHYSDWRTTDYLIPEEGYYIFSIGKNNDSTIFEDVSEVSRIFGIQLLNYEENNFRNKALNPEDFIKSKLIRGGRNYNTGAYVSNTTQATFYDYITIPQDILIVNLNGLQYQFAVYYLDSENNYHPISMGPLRGNFYVPANTRFLLTIQKIGATSSDIIPVQELADSIAVLTREKGIKKNIFNESYVYPGYINNSGNFENSSSANYPLTSDFIEIPDVEEREKVLAIQIFNPDETQKDWYCITYWNENKEFISRYSLYPNEFNIKHFIKLRPEAKYFRISYNHYLYNKIMVSYGFSFPEYKYYDIVDSNRKPFNFSNYGIYGIAHAGGGGSYENTLESYKIAKQRGYKFCECDIQFTSDNIPILMHDGSVDRTTNGTGTIRNMTLSQIQELYIIDGNNNPTNIKVPTFEEFIILCRDLKLIPQIELKMDNLQLNEYEELMTILFNIIKKYYMQDKVFYVSESYLKLLAMRNVDPYATLTHITFTREKSIESINRLYGILKNPVNKVIYASNVSYLSTEPIIERCKELGIQLDVWTFYNENAMLNLDQYITGATSETVRPYDKIMYDENIQ